MAYHASYKGIGEMLCAPWMIAEMKRRAERVKAVAEASAPVESGDYKASFDVDAGIQNKKTRRAVGTVINKSGHAMAVEYGMGNTPKHRTLGKALKAAGD